ncbi:hypothetical protein [Cellvibrio sp. OA-2007]|uniref:hypothetical protein n=1 Tax=Cellvibrio sp. OA-2007 TaxID=529823 RepID=UPI0007824964|nr:hypothetical protein [Cellvibrio sp. OA-2007]
MTESKSYALSLETLPALDFSHHLEDLIELRGFLEMRGISTKNTRIERYISYLKKIIEQNSFNAESIFKNSMGAPFNSNLDWMLYVLREIHELMWILKGLKVHIPPGINEKLNIIVSGRDFAALDSDTSSRNTQFELRIASYFCQAGCDVDLSTDTDVIALSDNQAFYVECKRVSGYNQLSKRLAEAKKQLRLRMPKKNGKRDIYGCIAADITKLAFSHNGLTLGATNEHSRDVIQEKLLEIVGRFQERQLFEDCRNVSSYWFQIHIPSLILQPPTTATRFSSYHVFDENMNRKQRRAAKEFINIFESVSKGDPRETPSKRLTPRNTFTFPKGTLFSFADELPAILAGDATSREEIVEDIASITINDQVHKFSTYDIWTIPAHIKEELQNLMKKDLVRAQVELVAKMYAQRFPYEQ